MKVFVSLILVLFLFGGYLSAQNSARLTDEFGPMNTDELMARLDAFAYEYQSVEADKLLIRIENGTEYSLIAPFIQGAVMKAYLTNNRKISGENVLVQYCGIGENDVDIRRQLFIIPHGAKIEACNEQIAPLKKTRYYGAIYTHNPYDTFDEITDGCCYIEGADKAAIEIREKILTELLAENPEVKVYLVGYAGHFTISKNVKSRNGEQITKEKKKTDPEKIADKLLAENKNALIKKGIDASRIVTVKGGYKKNYRKVELYLVPKDGELPTPKPDYFPKKKQSNRS